MTEREAAISALPDLRACALGPDAPVVTATTERERLDQLSSGCPAALDQLKKFATKDTPNSDVTPREMDRVVAIIKLKGMLEEVRLSYDTIINFDGCLNSYNIPHIYCIKRKPLF